MDVKGGSWVGGMYQKFEAMCVEVEEVMYEDTFKYVENQVRTVGETVKKFYSDVIQDLLPPSPSDSVKSEDELSSVFHQGEVKISKKPKVLDENESEKLVKDFGVASGHEDSVYVTSCSPIFSVIKPCRPMSMYSAGAKSAKENSWSQGTELILSNQAPSEAKHPNSFKDSEECLSNLPSIDKTIKNTFYGVTFSEPRNKSDELTSVNEDNSSKEVREMSQNEDGLGICRDVIECDGGGDADKVKKIRNLSSGPITTELNEHLSDLVCKFVPLKTVSSTEADLITTSTSSVENTIEVDNELSTFDIETSNPYRATVYKTCEDDDEGFLVEKLNEVKLGESCVLVEKNDNFLKSGPQNVQKSYKKKIQGVLSPRRWSQSKRYDEQCGIISLCTSNMTQEELRKSLMSEPYESDWELV